MMLSLIIALQIFLESNIINQYQTMQQEVYCLLAQTLHGDTTTINNTTNLLNKIAQSTQFSLILFNIIDATNLDYEIRLAALIQFKNNIKRRWGNPKLKLDNQISEIEKQFVRNQIINATIKCGNDYKLIKLYRQVIRIIVLADYQHWIPQHQIQRNLIINQQLPQNMYCLLGICASFQFAIVDKQRKKYSEFLSTMLPLTFKVLNDNAHNIQLLYLGIKFLWKALHYEAPISIKVLANQWMEFVFLIISSYNEDLHQKFEFQPKYTPQFYYFHSKKWATRILLRFVQKHAKQKVFGSVLPPENIAYAKNWHQVYGPKFIDTIVSQISMPTTIKIRYFQFKVIQGWVIDKPALMIQYAQSFLLNHLQPYMTLKPQDEYKADSDPIEYIRSEQCYQFTFTNLKRAAMQLWISFLQLGSKNDRKMDKYYAGPFFHCGFQLIVNQLSSQNLLVVEVAMYLLCKMKLIIAISPQYKVKIPEILENYIIPRFQNQQLLIKIRAIEVFMDYGDSGLSPSIISNILQQIFICLGDTRSILQIKALTTIKIFLNYQTAYPLLRKHLKQILLIYMKLINLYELESLVISLQLLIKKFESQIGIFAIQLFDHLTNLFQDLYLKDKRHDKNQEYGGEAEIAATGILKSLIHILEFSLDNATRKILEVYILKITHFLLQNKAQDYLENLMKLFNCHIYSMETMTQDTWFFFHAIIYFLVGMPQDDLSLLQQFPQQSMNYQTLQNLITVKKYNIQYIEYVTPILRNYMSKIQPIIETNNNAKILQSFLKTLFYLVRKAYEQSQQQASEEEISFNSIPNDSSILLVYFVQTFKTQTLTFSPQHLNDIWIIIKQNIMNSSSIYRKLINVQLISACLWKIPDWLLRRSSQDDGMFTIILDQIISLHSRLSETHERKRLILGIISLLNNWRLLDGNKMNQIPILFKVLVELVIKNCKLARIQFYQQKNMKEQEKREIIQLNALEGDNIDQEESYDDRDDDEEFWDENYGEKHLAKLSEVNEIQLCMKMMGGLQSNSPQFYSHLLQSVPQIKIQQVERQLQSTINLQLNLE